MSAAIVPGSIGAALLSFCLLAGIASCAESTPEARAVARPTAPYVGRGADLFDDGIDPGAVGYSASDVGKPNSDIDLRERAQTADAVVRARIITLTSREDQGWLVGLRPLETITGAPPPPGDIVLQVHAGDRAAGVVRAFQDRLAGVVVVAFLRTFAGEGNASSGENLHFHIAPDSPAEVQAIRAAALLAEVH